MADRPSISSAEHARRYPNRIVVMRASRHPGRAGWWVFGPGSESRRYPTHAEAFADAWARTHPKEET